MYLFKRNLKTSFLSYIYLTHYFLTVFKKFFIRTDLIEMFFKSVKQ